MHRQRPRSDLLFPPDEQAFLAAHIPGAVYKAIDSDYGHDGFLLEYEQIEKAITEFLDEESNPEPEIQKIINGNT